MATTEGGELPVIRNAQGEFLKCFEWVFVEGMHASAKELNSITLKLLPTLGCL